MGDVDIPSAVRFSVAAGSRNTKQGVKVEVGARESPGPR